MSNYDQCHVLPHNRPILSPFLGGISQNKTLKVREVEFDVQLNVGTLLHCLLLFLVVLG